MTQLIGLMALDVATVTVLILLVGTAGELNPFAREAWAMAGLLGLVLLKVPGAIGVAVVSRLLRNPDYLLIPASAITFVGVALNTVSLVLLGLAQ